MLRLVVTLAAVLFATPVWSAPAPFELKDGDRVVFLGNTFVERDQTNGYLETFLTAHWPDRHVTFRNLGWSGDTVFGHARAVFGSVEDGFKELQKNVVEAKPTVIFICYGMNESFEGQAGLEHFNKGLARLLDTLSATGARLVLVGPNRHENLGSPLPDPAAHNQQLAAYTAAIAEQAKQRNAHFVDLFAALPDGATANPPAPLTDNGIHFNPRGYWRAAAAIERGLELGKSDKLGEWHVTFFLKDKASAAVGANLTESSFSPTGIQFKALDKRLPRPAIPSGGPEKLGQQAPAAPLPADLEFAERTLQVSGLAPGQYALKIDGQEVARAGHDAWGAGVKLLRGPEFAQVEKLRQLTLDKNSLFFHRWRPQNWTYLFGFRKHEQGNNAKEIPEFDPLIAAKEAEIAKVRVPQPHTYVLEGVK